MVFGSQKTSASSSCVDELKQQVQDLQSDLRGLQESKANQNDLEGLAHRLSDMLGQLKKTRTADYQAFSQESSNYTKTCIENLSSQIVRQLSKLEEKRGGAVSSALSSLDSELRSLIQEETDAITQRFDAEVAAMKEDFMTFFKSYGEDIANSIIEQRQELDACLSQMKQQVESESAFVHRLSVNMDQFSASSKMLEENMDYRSTGTDYADLLAEVKQLKAQAEESKLPMQESKVKLSPLATITAEHSEDRLGKLEVETMRLASAMSEVENLATKRVHWVIRNASKLSSARGSPGRLHTSWFSPKFDACGCHGLQLEVQVFNEETTNDKQELGNLAAFLWASKGMTIAFRLSVGSKSMALERTFNGRVSHGTPRFCWLNEQIDASDDTLTIAIEVLETFREIEHPIQLSPLPEETPERPAYDERIAKMPENSMEGSLFFKRHISHRLLDQVRKEVEVMRSRMIRKIDWKLQNASSLQRSFPKNRAVCSAHFNAAGVDGFQFVFYPSGYHSASTGYYSLYVYGPVGASVRCFLSLGKQRRQISHTFNEPGAFGRTNFVSWEESGVIDHEDTILIRLEIEEAHQDMNMLGKPEDADEIPAFESVVKLVRNNSKSFSPTAASVASAPGLDNHLVLPSLWTANRLGDGQSPRDAFHRFDQLPNPGNMPTPNFTPNLTPNLTPNMTPDNSPRYSSHESASGNDTHRSRTLKSQAPLKSCSSAPLLDPSRANTRTGNKRPPSARHLS